MNTKIAIWLHSTIHNIQSAMQWVLLFTVTYINDPNVNKLAGVHNGDYSSKLVHFEAQKNVFYVKKALA